MFVSQIGETDHSTTCCMKIELASFLVETGDENTDAEFKAQTLEGFAVLGLPSAVGESMHMCTYEWAGNITAPIFDSNKNGIVWDVYCDGAVKALTGVAAITASLFAVSF